MEGVSNSQWMAQVSQAKSPLQPRKLYKTATGLPKANFRLAGAIRATALTIVATMAWLLSGCAAKRPFLTDWNEPNAAKREQLRSARLAEAVSIVSKCASLSEASKALGAQPDRFADMGEITMQLSDSPGGIPVGSVRAAVWEAGLETNDPSNNWREELWLVLAEHDRSLAVFDTIVPG
jgi:hypothetical protein